jgi:DNA polymerase III epsilon subunit-like protein
MYVENSECFISVDVETAGPDPGAYSLLSIGACLVSDPDQGFYVELKPTTKNATEEALTVSGFTLEALEASGVPPKEAMQRFEAWLGEVNQSGARPIFVAFNAAFDWMFINQYFHRYLGHNPFGHAALDIKAFFMALAGNRWTETGMRHAAQRYGYEIFLTHHALDDAKDQARLFRKMLREATEIGQGRSRDSTPEEVQE